VITVSPRDLRGPTDLETVPGDGAITSWRIKGYTGGPGAMASWRLRVLRLNGDTWMGAGTSPPALEAAVNGFSIPLAAPLPVLAGD
jgi:hypothetical protein